MQTSSICVDASFIVRLLVPDRFSEEAEQRWLEWEQAGTKLVAPTLILFEVSSTLRRMVFLKALSSKRGDEALSDFRQINLHISHDRPVHTLAWQLAKHFKQSRTYDMTYLAVAQLNDCTFWTADERLYNSVRHELAWVNWIGISAPKS